MPMDVIHIAEVISETIEDIIYTKWRHPGYIDQLYSNEVHCWIDGKKYIIRIEEVLRNN